MFICVACKQEMRCVKNGVGAVLPGQCVHPSDRYQCPHCGIQILHANNSWIAFDIRDFDEYLYVPEEEMECPWPSPDDRGA